jgi:hypothetical protein
MAQRLLVLFQLLLQAKIFFAKQSHLIPAAKPGCVNAPKGLRAADAAEYLHYIAADPLATRVAGAGGEVIQDQQVVFVELGNGSFESELAAGDLQPLDEIGGSGEQHAPAIFDESEAESCRKVALAAARWPKRRAP